MRTAAQGRLPGALSVEFGGASRPGGGRRPNGDAWAVLKRDGGELAFIVVDGMGGGGFDARAGSRIAMESLARSFMEGLDAEGAMRRASWDFQTAGPNVGAAAIAGILRDGTLDVSWCGDCAALLAKDGGCARLTTPHRRSGIPYSVLSRAVPSPEVGSLRHGLAPNERIVFATDGVTDALSRSEIGIICSCGTCGEAAERVVSASCPGRDDSTAIVLEPSARTGAMQCRME